jgi:hypothetical protein
MIGDPPVNEPFKLTIDFDSVGALAAPIRIALLSRRLNNSLNMLD